MWTGGNSDEKSYLGDGGPLQAIASNPVNSWFSALERSRVPVLLHPLENVCAYLDQGSASQSNNECVI